MGLRITEVFYSDETAIKRYNGGWLALGNTTPDHTFYPHYVEQDGDYDVHISTATIYPYKQLALAALRKYRKRQRAKG